MESAAPRRPAAAAPAPKSSRLPLPRPGRKRGAADENAPPPAPLQKRARGVPAPGAESAAPRPRAAAGRRRSFARATIGVGAAAPLAAPPAAAAASAKEKKRAPWDLKGQVSDLREKVGAYKERIQGLAGENEALKDQLGGLQQELSKACAQEKELSGQNSLLASELQLCRGQVTESTQRVAALLEKERRLEETLESHAQTIEVLETLNREIGEGSRELAVQLRAREGELLVAQQSLAEQRQQKEVLGAQVAELEWKLHESEMQRRVLHNAVQELKGNIRVFCRVRPLLAWERQAQKVISHLRFPADNNRGLVLSRAEESHVGRERRDDITYEFTFDRVFPPASSQESVFEEISLLVQSALDGYHVCIFAYGQTGSGKTYTMEGPHDTTADTAGVIPRAVRQVFATSREMAAKGWKYRFTANMLEIYNEALRDLLVPQSEQNGDLEIRRVNHHTEELHVPNLRYVPVSSEEEVLQLLLLANAHRSVAKTSLNEHSSRSHSLFQLRIEGENSGRDLRTSSMLSLVDLAGSERLDKSLSCGERLKETQAINSSLSNLGLVITALSNKEAHIPYRNSKLTYLLQNSLGGSSKMLMFVNISPLEENFGESLNSLRFARKVNECMIGTASSNRK